MGIVLSLQGGMAAGKTTAARHVEKNLPGVYVSYENPGPLVREIRQRKLDYTTFDGFVEIQRLFLKAEIERWKGFKHYPLVLQDLGGEEIEFYTLFYPKAIGMDWDLESALAKELRELRQCEIDATLFLDVSLHNLRSHKEGDESRSRGSFEFSVQNLLGLKKEWLAARGSTTFMNVDGLSQETVGELVLCWVQENRISQKVKA